MSGMRPSAGLLPNPRSQLVEKSRKRSLAPGQEQAAILGLTELLCGYNDIALTGADRY